MDYSAFTGLQEIYEVVSSVIVVGTHRTVRAEVVKVVKQGGLLLDNPMFEARYSQEEAVYCTIQGEEAPRSVHIWTVASFPWIREGTAEDALKSALVWIEDKAGARA